MKSSPLLPYRTMALLIATWALEAFIRQGRGALSEGDIFATLVDDKRVLYSFEFGTVDGALTISSQLLPEGASYVERLERLTQTKNDPNIENLNDLILFDIKSSTSRVAGEQVYVTPILQRKCVAFYLAICTADSRYIELIPNTSYATSSYSGNQDGVDEKRLVAVNASRKLFLDGSTYGFLDPCAGPYCMPIGLLLEALRRVRRCAVTGEAYINPWTQVRVDGWTPLTTNSIDAMLPAVGGPHYSVYVGTIIIFWAIRQAAASILSIPLRLDFIGVAPRLADFKLILEEKR